MTDLTDLSPSIITAPPLIPDYNFGVEIPDYTDFIPNLEEFDFGDFNLSTVEEFTGLAEEFGPIIDSLKDVLSEEALQILEGDFDIQDAQAFAALVENDVLFGQLITEIGAGNKISDLFSDPTKLQNFIDGNVESDELQNVIDGNIESDELQNFLDGNVESDESDEISNEVVNECDALVSAAIIER